MTNYNDKPPFICDVCKGLIGAMVLLFVDVIWLGSFGCSFLICPIWFLVSFIKSVVQRPGWPTAIVRLAVPVITLTIVLVNDNFQRKVAAENAEKIITACEKFQAENGIYPKKLDDLVPRYIPSIPPAKHSLGPFGSFMYYSSLEKTHILVWIVIPPFERKIYTFEEKEWDYID